MTAGIRGMQRTRWQIGGLIGDAKGSWCLSPFWQQLADEHQVPSAAARTNARFAGDSSVIVGVGEIASRLGWW